MTKKTNPPGLIKASVLCVVSAMAASIPVIGLINFVTRKQVHKQLTMAEEYSIKDADKYHTIRPVALKIMRYIPPTFLVLNILLTIYYIGIYIYMQQILSGM